MPSLFSPCVPPRFTLITAGHTHFETRQLRIPSVPLSPSVHGLVGPGGGGGDFPPGLCGSFPLILGDAVPFWFLVFGAPPQAHLLTPCLLQPCCCVLAVILPTELLGGSHLALALRLRSPFFLECSIALDFWGALSGAPLHALDPSGWSFDSLPSVFYLFLLYFLGTGFSFAHSLYTFKLDWMVFISQSVSSFSGCVDF